MSGDDRTPEDRRDEPTDDQDHGHWLSSLLSALDWLDEASKSGRRRGDRTTVDYDVSIRSLDALEDRTEFEREPLSGVGSGDRDRDRNRPRTRRYRTDSPSSSTAPSGDHHLTTRETEDELLVTADVAGADPDDVTVGFDDATLVVAVDGSELGRITVPWADHEADATIKNGVLTVQIVPVSSDDPGTDETDTETRGADDE